MFGNNTGGGFGAFGNNNNQNQGGLFGGNKPNGGGLFGGNNQQNAGGVFGGNNNNGGVFGNTQPAFGQPATQTQGLFGNAQGNSNSPFGNNQNQQQGLFGNNNQQTQQGLFGNQQQPQQNNGLFGNNQPSNNNGLFGAAQQQPQQQGLFGNNQQQNNTGLFGGNNNTAGNGLFGNNNNQQQQAQGNGLFGATQNNGGGLFGAASNNANNAFLGNQTQQANPFNTNNNTFANTGLFGGNNNTAGNSLFGNNNNQQQQQQPNNAGGLFNTFAPANNTQPANGFFGQTNNLATNAPANNSIFGGNNTFNNNTNNNKLGGTAWGVPTPALNTSPSVANIGTQTIQPVKSKNSKLDAKHMVKCIAALDQFTGLTKEEIRINFVQSGGQQPVINQQALQPQGYAANQNGFKPIGSTFTAQTSLPSFGGITTNNNIAPTTSLFGQNQPAQQGVFGAKPAFGNTPAQGTSLFGQPAQQGATSLFGAQPQQQTSLFGQPAATQPNTFGQTSLFGQNSPAQPATSLFGGQPAQTTSLFGQPAQTTPSLFGQPAQTAPSLFGGQPAQTTSLFGAPQPTTSLFGQTPAAGQTPSLFNTAPTAFNAQPSGGFGAVQPQTGFFNQPASAFGQLTAPLYQAPQGLDPSLQVLLPQLLLSLALNQPQNTNPDANNSITDLISKLTTLVAANNSATSASNTAASTPFDQFMKQAKKETVQQKKESDQTYSLFSDFQKQSNYYLDSSSFGGHNYKSRDEPYQLQAVHKVPKREESYLRSDRDYRQVPLRYKNSEDQSRKKFGASANDLPRIGDFQISPSLERLKSKTSDQLRSVPKVKIWNDFGQIQFLEPVNLFRLNLDESVRISQDNIEITDSDLEDKPMRMTFRNFGKYTSLKGEDREKMLKRMRKWMQKYEMREISHNESNGDLVVQVDN